jgi:hypothetical protein
LSRLAFSNSFTQKSLMILSPFYFSRQQTRKQTIPPASSASNIVCLYCSSYLVVGLVVFGRLTNALSTHAPQQHKAAYQASPQCLSSSFSLPTQQLKSNQSSFQSISLKLHEPFTYISPMLFSFSRF